MSNKKENNTDFSFSDVSRSRSHNKPHFTLTETVRCILCLSFSVIGLLLIFFNDQIHELLPFILGGFMILAGLVFAIQGLRSKEHLVSETKQTANGLIFLILGVVIICNLRIADALIGAIWGVVGLIKGSEDLNETIYSLSHKKPFIIKLIRTAITLFLSVYLLLDPASNVHHHLFILGLELIVSGFEFLFDEHDEEEMQHAMEDEIRHAQEEDILHEITEGMLKLNAEKRRAEYEARTKDSTLKIEDNKTKTEGPTLKIEDTKTKNEGPTLRIEDTRVQNNE